MDLFPNTVPFSDSRKDVNFVSTPCNLEQCPNAHAWLQSLCPLPLATLLLNTMVTMTVVVVMMAATIILIFTKGQILFYALGIHSLGKTLQQPMKSII